MQGMIEQTVLPTDNGRHCFEVQIIDDSVYRTDRRFQYSLGSRDPRVVVPEMSGSAEIRDNDGKAVAIGFEQIEYTVMEGGSIDVCVWMTSGAVDQPFTIQVSTELTSNINPSEFNSFAQLSIS